MSYYDRFAVTGGIYYIVPCVYEEVERFIDWSFVAGRLMVLLFFVSDKNKCRYLTGTPESSNIISTAPRFAISFNDSGVPVRYLHLFLSDTKKDQTPLRTPSKRDWVTAERPAWAWQGIYDWLLERRYVSLFSNGPDSYEYIGTAYQNLCVYFLTRPIPNLGLETA